jgi:CheY-like chemotaxis protein
VEDGPDAIALCQQSEFDLILMDNFMPKMMGVDCIKILRGEVAHSHPWMKTVPIGNIFLIPTTLFDIFFVSQWACQLAHLPVIRRVSMRLEPTTFSQNLSLY